ncbi:MAG: HNH endonuclease [Kiritimatiellae bacterium]|nr:HNH endonuclease [Kiritimatiellia bacterium]
MSAETVNASVLVLNRLWQVVNICTAERALGLLFTGHAQVVHEDGGSWNTFSFLEWCDFSHGHTGEDVVRTVSLRIRIPRIILLLFFERLPNKDIKLTRHNVFERDRGTCQYCGKRYDRKDLNIDHVVPRHRGGVTTWDNVVCSCMRCNSRKSNRTPEEAGMHLIRRPKKPRWHPFIEIKFRRTFDHSWRHFLDVAYWNVEIGEEEA